MLNTQAISTLPLGLPLDVFVGRDRHVADLTQLLGNAFLPRSAVAFVTGRAGYGKSALVRQVLQTVLRPDDWLVSFKYDQFTEASPASLFVNGLEIVAERMLAMDDGPREAIRRRLVDAISPNGQLVVNLCGRMDAVLGPQPELIQLAPQENQTRVSFVLRRFFAALSGRKGRLFIHVDDLQWADAGTRRILEDMIADSSLQNLALIIAHRSGDFGGDFEGAATLRRIVRTVGNPSVEIELDAMDESEIADILSRLAPASDRPLGPLSASIRKATGGNPLAIVNVVDLLSRQSRKSAASSGGDWTVADDAVERLALGDGIDDLLQMRLAGLDAEERDLLGMAAHIGDRVDVALLHRVSGVDENRLAATCARLCRAQILEEIGGGRGGESVYRFAHDTFQRFARDRPDPQAARGSDIRLKAATVFAERFEQTGDGTWLFRATTLYNAEVKATGDGPSRAEIVRLNRIAARRSLDSGDPKMALEFALAGLSAMSDAAWVDDYEDVRQAHHDGAEAAYLSNDLDALERLVSNAAKHARDNIDWAAANRVRLQHRVSAVRYEEALDIAVEMLEKLNAGLPRSASKLDVGLAFARTAFRLRGLTTADLLALPTMNDPRAEMELDTLMLAASAAYFAAPNLFPLIVFRMVRLSVDAGNSRLSAFGWVCYGLAQCAVLGNMKAGYAYGELALRLVERFSADDLRARIHMLFNTFVRHWSESRARGTEHLLEGERAGFASGDLEFATYCSWHRCNDAFWSGTPLPDIAVTVDRALSVSRDCNQSKVLFLLGMMRQFLDWATASDGGTPDDATHDAFCLQNKDYTSYCYVKLYQALRFALEGRVDEARAATAEIGRHHEALQGQFYVPYCVLIEVHAAATLAVRGAGRRHVLTAIAGTRKLRRWSRKGAVDVMPLAALADALAAWALGRRIAALRGFDQVMAQALAGRAPAWVGMLAATALRDLHGDFGARLAADLLQHQISRLAASWGCAKLAGGIDVAHPQDTGATAPYWAAADDTVLRAQHASREDWIEAVCARVLDLAGADRLTLTLADQQGPRDLLDATRTARDGLRLVYAAGDVPRTDSEPLRTVTADPDGDAQTLAITLPRPDGLDVTAQFVLRPDRSRSVPMTRIGQCLDPIVAELRLADTDRRLSRAEEDRVNLRTAYARFIPGYTLKELGRSEIVDVRVGDHASKQMTAMFCDMRGATGIMEKLSPTASLDLFNELFIAIESEVIRGGGFIDSFLGDAVLALFGAEPDTALRTATRVAGALHRLRAEMLARDLPAPGFGLGLSTGEVVFGVVGGLNQIRIGAIGDTLNLASWVESLTKRYGASALISDKSFDLLTTPQAFTLRQVDHVTVVGRKDAVRLFEVVDALPTDRADAVRANLPLYQEAIDAFYAAHFTAAERAFAAFLVKVPDDVAAAILRARAARMRDDPPDADWQGVHALKEK